MNPIQYGLALPYGPARTTADYAQLAEECGWDGVYAGDAIWCADPMIQLTAAAMVTKRIRLGTMVIPVPLRKPWKIASESIALEHLSEGRLTLGLGAGAVWMGWQGFPDEVTDTRARAEMLDETIDILTILFERKFVDYDGKHFHLKLSLLEERHFPPKPIQQPRIPLWCVGIWPRMKSMRRVLKCDGLLPMKMNEKGEVVQLTPEDIREMKTYIDTNRSLTTPFDIVVEGQTGGLNTEEARQKVQPWIDAGATWWVEGLWDKNQKQVLERIRQGPPR